MDFLPFQINLSVIRCGNATDTFHDLRTAGTYQSCQPQDLTCANAEGNIPEISGPGKIFHPEHFFSELYLRFREKIFDLTAYHSFDQIRIGNAIHIIGTNILRITEYRYPVSQAVHIFETVRNEDDGNAFRFQLIHDPV